MSLGAVMLGAVLITLSGLSYVWAAAHPIGTCDSNDSTSCINAADVTDFESDRMDDDVGSDMKFQLLQTSTVSEHKAKPLLPLNAEQSAAAIISVLDVNKDGMVSHDELALGHLGSGDVHKIAEDSNASSTSADMLMRSIADRLSTLDTLTTQDFRDLMQLASHHRRASKHKKLMAEEEFARAIAVQNQIATLRRQLDQSIETADDYEARFVKETMNGPSAEMLTASLKGRWKAQREQIKARENEMHKLLVVNSTCTERAEFYQRQANEAEAKEREAEKQAQIAKLVLRAKVLTRKQKK